MKELVINSPDGLAQFFTTMFKLAMTMEREQYPGAGLHQRCDERNGTANGYKSKKT